MEELDRTQKCSILGPQNLGPSGDGSPSGSATVTLIGIENSLRKLESWLSHPFNLNFWMLLNVENQYQN